jgi:sugar lactone lactonase YvrE
VKLLPSLLFTLLLLALPGTAAEIHTIAGNGAAGASGDGGAASAAQVNDPTGLCRVANGTILFCDTANHRVRSIAPGGTITTLAGNGTKGYSGDGGPATGAQLNEPYEVRVDQAGNIFFVERLNHVVRRIDGRSGVITTVAGNGKPGFSGDGGPATQASLKEPHSIQFDAAGNLYICDTLNHRIRKVDAQTRIITTFSGTGVKKPVEDGPAFATSPLSGPRALDFDAEGNLWLALREGNAV